MNFDARWLRQEIGEFVAETIAHELAHVYQWAAGYRPALADPEADAHRLTAEWEFYCGTRRKLSRTQARLAVEVAREVARKIGAP